MHHNVPAYTYLFHLHVTPHSVVLIRSHDYTTVEFSFGIMITRDVTARENDAATYDFCFIVHHNNQASSTVNK